MTEGVWVGSRFFRKRLPPTEAEMAAHEEYLHSPIIFQRDTVDGYRCDDCDHWWPDQHRMRGNGGGRTWLLRWGCPDCASKSLTHEKGFMCKTCGGLIGSVDWTEHHAVCGGGDG